MDGELMRAVTALTERLVAQASQDDGLWKDLRALAAAILMTTERPVPLLVPELAQQGIDGNVTEELRPEIVSQIPEETGRAAVVSTIISPAALLPELTLGKSRPVGSKLPSGPTLVPGRTIPTDADLPTIEANCRLKAEGLRWAATRRRRMDEGAEFRVEIAPRDREILDRAKNVGCYLWMCTPDFSVPREPASLEDVAGWFEATADAVALLRGVLLDVNVNREMFEQTLDLLAEVQSALKVVIDRVGGLHDPDQLRIYDWLRGAAAREQIYIPRHMRLDDPADPTRLPEIEERIEGLDTRLQEANQRTKKRKSHFGRLRYHAKLLGDGTGGEHDWRKVAGAIEELLAEGMLPSNVDIREALLPVIETMPDLDALPPAFGLVLREIDRYLASRMSPQEATTAELPIPEVARARGILSGKSLVLIGGKRRPESYEALKAALGLKELIWIETREHESIDRFEPLVARPEVAVVLLAIRWSSHSFGDVREFCNLYGKPMVRLPSGYGVNQVASQIIAQCGDRLGAESGGAT